MPRTVQVRLIDQAIRTTSVGLGEHATHHPAVDLLLTMRGSNSVSMPPWHCPNHEGQRVHESDDVLACASGDYFPIVRGIPRFVTGSTYADAFGLEWNVFRRTQLDSHSGSPITATRLRDSLGVGPERLGGLQVLEAGCGAGRFTEILLKSRAYVTSIDISSGVEANADNFPPNDHHRVAQADIRHLPFQPGQFDVVVCLGVLQHTPNPELALAKLYRQVKPAGLLVVDHYARALGWYTRTAPLIREVLRRMPPARSAAVTHRLVRTFLPMHKRLAHRTLASRFLARLSPVVTYFDVYPALSEDLQREWAELDTFDSLTDRYKHFRTVRSLRSAFEALGLANIECFRLGGIVVARGQRP